MPQAPRPNPSGWFHVMNRGARRWDVFLDDEDRHLFLHLLAGVRIRFDVRVVSYCLMNNHFHLVLHCPEPALSQAMQWLASNYVRIFNKKHGFDGPLCRSRFRSVEICDDTQLVAVVRYIHRNPLDLAPQADLGAYEWSSHGSYLGIREEPWWLDTAAPLHVFGRDRAAFRQSVETVLPFDKVKNRASETKRLEPANGDVASGPRSVDEIKEAVANVSASEVRDVVESVPGQTNDRRDAALLVANDHALVPPHVLAPAFGFQSTDNVRKALSRARKRSAINPELAWLIASTRRFLSTTATQSHL